MSSKVQRISEAISRFIIDNSYAGQQARQRGIRLSDYVHSPKGAK